MAELKKIVDFLDNEFSFFAGFDTVYNGLQFEGNSSVNKIALAVDACLETFTNSIKQDADLLIVHHGLFKKDQPLIKIDSLWANRLRVLSNSEMSLYAAHLPLDAHPVFGNNSILAKLFRTHSMLHFAQCGGVNIGCYGRLPKKLTVKDLAKLTEKIVKTKPRYWSFGPKKIGVVGFCSGRGAFAINELSQLKIDCLITGEITHSTFNLMKETHANVIAAGHYATETFGLKALGEHLKKKFEVSTVFVDAPTGF